MPPLVGVVLAYLIGSIPAAYLAGRLVKGVDLREHGSRNLGATNVLRVLGWKVAVPVLLVDVAKGAAPVLVLPPLTNTAYPHYAAIAYGIVAIIGHVKPVFLLWRGGGKGVATAAGVFLGLAPLPTAIALVVFIAVVLVSGYVSLGSLAAAATLPLAVAATSGAGSPLFVISVMVGLFVVWTHRANVGRLRRGEEHRFGRKRPL